MAIFSPLKSRRLTTHKAEVTQQVIVFRLKQEWFALPITSLQQVVPLGKVYGDPQKTGVSLTIYQNKEILVIDVGCLIFRETPELELSISSSNKEKNRDLGNYLIVVKNTRGELVGLPIDSPPSLRRIPESAIAPLPTGYISQGNIQCVCSLIIQAQDEPPLFLLNPEQLTVDSGQLIVDREQ